METDSILNWAVETIPEKSYLFYRVPKGSLKPGETMHPSIFTENGGSMSTDWDRYSDPQKTLSCVENPNRFRVIRLIADYIRNNNKFEINHSPNIELKNRAHTDVFGVTTKNGVKLAQDEITENRFYLFHMYQTWEFVA